MNITDIYRVNFQKDRFAYVGLLRNQKVFKIGDSVFFSPSKENDSIARGVVCGVELIPNQNPEYRYKIVIPKELCKETSGIFENIVCDSIFPTIDEAKESAEKNCKNKYEIQMKEIENFFKQFQH